MKNALLLITAVFLLSIQFACKKDKITYTIKGSVADQTFSSNLSGATVKLYITEAGSSSPKLINSLTTASDGSYTFTFERGNYQNVKIVVEKQNYFPQEKSFILDDLSVEDDNSYNFSTKAKGWVNIHFIGDGTQDVTYFKSSGLNNCSECCPTGEFTFLSVSDEQVICINNGNENYGIYYKVDGVTNFIPVSVTTTAFDTTEMQINI